MIEKTRASIMQIYDSELARIIAKNRNISEMDGLRIFLTSKTHEMLLNNEKRLWYFSPLVIYDMWENEITTGDPTNSLYIRGDEIA